MTHRQSSTNKVNPKLIIISTFNDNRKLTFIFIEPVTLKSRLKVTQGHWKRNHWIDHTRLTIRGVIWRWKTVEYYRDLEMWVKRQFYSVCQADRWPSAFTRWTSSNFYNSRRQITANGENYGNHDFHDFVIFCCPYLAVIGKCQIKS